MLSQADKAGTQTKEAREKELIKLAYNSAKTKKVKNKNYENVIAEELQPELENQKANAQASDEDDEETLRVKFKDTGNEYLISQDGEVVKTTPNTNVTSDTSGASTPKILSGMTKKTFDENGNPRDLQEGEEWYNYSENKWANAQTEDGSMWVWIPRFEYKITPPEEPYTTESAGTIDVNFISKNKMNPTDGFKIHPAFLGVGHEDEGGGFGKDEKGISGFWVAKYEMSAEDSNGNNMNISDASIGNVCIYDDKSANYTYTGTIAKMVSKPGVRSWKYINAANCYENSYYYDRNKESHLIKNSEWGAIAYLTHSKYGRDRKEVSINYYQEYYTAGAPNAFGLPYPLQSSTGNKTGIFDLSGGAFEEVAAFNNAYKGESFIGANYLNSKGKHFASTGGKSTKYATAYTNSTSEYKGEIVTTVCKDGDGIAETYLGTISNNSRGWFGDTLQIVCKSWAFFVRSASYNSGVDSGIFCASAGYGSCSLSSSFRVVLNEG